MWRTLCCALILAVAAWGLPAAQPVRAATYTVTNTLDSGTNSLRWAINQANASTGVADVITFNIPGTDAGCAAGVCTIKPASTLPVLIDPAGVTIDGYTQPGAAYATLSAPAVIKIELDGSFMPDNVASVGLVVTSAHNVVRGLAINRFPSHGVAIGKVTGTDLAAANTISGNHIGTNAAGTANRGNGIDGVMLTQGAYNNTVGGDEPGERNVISGNGWDGVAIYGTQTNSNSVLGNYIGLNAAGTAALGNTYYGVWVYGGAHLNYVGGNTPAWRNIIAGNLLGNVHLSDPQTSDNGIMGNYIGTNPAGTLALGGKYGVYLSDGARATNIGGITVGARNLISGNEEDGIFIEEASTSPNYVRGNWIGLNAAGTAALANGTNGIRLANGAHDNLIGGDSAEERNLISGNNEDGVNIHGSGTDDNVVSANWIGLDPTGLAVLDNVGAGVRISGGAQSNILGGNSAGEGNVMSSGFTSATVIILDAGTASNRVSGNYIGTEFTGMVGLHTANGGVKISAGATFNTVGGCATQYESNVISGGSSSGVLIQSVGTNYNTVACNRIGVAADGVTPLGNGLAGVSISAGSHNMIGWGNIIANNTLDGVTVIDYFADDNQIFRNSIYANGLLGIILYDHANNDINHPTITGAGVGLDSVSGTACANCIVEVFASRTPDGEGEVYLGTVTATGGGTFTLGGIVIPYPYLTATATKTGDGTSEFSTVYTAPFDFIYLPVISR